MPMLKNTTMVTTLERKLVMVTARMTRMRMITTGGRLPTRGFMLSPIHAVTPTSARESGVDMATTAPPKISAPRAILPSLRRGPSASASA